MQHATRISPVENHFCTTLHQITPFAQRSEIPTRTQVSVRSAAWSAVTCHRFAAGTCRRRLGTG